MSIQDTSIGLGLAAGRWGSIVVASLLSLVAEAQTVPSIPITTPAIVPATYTMGQCPAGQVIIPPGFYAAGSCGIENYWPGRYLNLGGPPVTPACPNGYVLSSFTALYTATNSALYYQGECKISAKYQCPEVLPNEPPYTLAKDELTCSRPDQEKLVIALQGGTTTPPSTILPFSAIVKNQNGVAQVGKQVVITANVPDGTGGHIHTANRPKGTFTCASSLGASSATCTLTTDYNGQTPFEFVATPVSGTHTITATCAGCSNTATAQVDVKVDGLIPIPAAPQLYALQDYSGTVIGAVAGKHTANHYLTSAAIGKLRQLADLYKVVNPTAKLYLNDASLEWGGLFDVGSSTLWSSPHSTHDKGSSLDIRAANSGPNNEGAVPVTVFQKFIKKTKGSGLKMGLHCKNSSDTNYCLGQPNNRHFHVDF